MDPPPAGVDSAQALQPWRVGAQNMYSPAGPRAGGGSPVPPPPPREPGEPDAHWTKKRANVLREWGRRRERFMHRPPTCLMDQMVSGSGLFPPRLLSQDWLLPHEQVMVSRLERLLQGTGRGRDLAFDMLTPLIYDVDVKVVLDNSGSMQLDMFGQMPSSYYNNNFIEAQGPENPGLMRGLLSSKWTSWRSRPTAVAPSPLNPHRRRWFFARDALRRWKQVFEIIGLDPWVYLLNPPSGGGVPQRCLLSQVERIFSRPPEGRTPMAEALQWALADRERDSAGRGTRGLLLLALTDGEANDMNSFNYLLDACQNWVHGDVQVCLLGLSLVPADIEWFENEECDETRIRTIEAYEVEAYQIRMKEVVTREDGYNFDMHSYRALVTNFYPADYDYEAPLQNLRHRMYITMHGRDRWWGMNNPCWFLLCSRLFCTACFLATGGHCCGWCQGNECGKCQKPEMLESCCEEE